VSRNFKALRALNGIFEWGTIDAAAQIGNHSLSMVQKIGPGPNGLVRTTVKVIVPTLEVTSPSTASGIQPAPTVAYVCEFHATTICPKRSARTDRETVISYGAQALTKQPVLDAVLDHIQPS
jgi:hypothetical protein